MENIFETSEIQRLSEMLLQGQGYADQESLRVLYQWAYEARMNGTMLDLILEGKLYVSVKGEEVCLKNVPCESITANTN